MSIAFRRVTDAVLLRWLDEAPARLERYLAANPEASARLEALTALGPDFEQQLQEAIAPDDDFSARMVRAVTPPARSAETPALLLDMLTLPWRTASLLVDPRRGQGDDL